MQIYIYVRYFPFFRFQADVEDSNMQYISLMYYTTAKESEAIMTAAESQELGSCPLLK